VFWANTFWANQAQAQTPAQTQTQTQERPNILFIMSDDHAYQALSCYGGQLNKTPMLDRLATEGMLFRSAYVTNSICGPSRAVILTGLYSHRNGFRQNGNRFNGNQVTVSRLLQAAGYQTAVIGKWHLESDPVGFDHWSILVGQGPYYNPAMIENGQRKQHTGYTTDIITDQALEWLSERRDPQKPFFLMYQHKAPHRNWLPGPKHFDLFEDTTFPEPETLFDDYAGRSSAAKSQAMTIASHMTKDDLHLVPPKGLNPAQLAEWNKAYEPKNEAFRAAKLEGKELVRWQYQRYLKDYLRCVASVDDNVGRVLKYLDDSGLAKNTVVIYTSDQGFYLGEHGWYDKRWMYEESFRTPLMIRWPGRTAPGSVNNDFVMNLDLAETFLQIAGLPIPSEMQGRSLVPLLKGQRPEDWRTSMYYRYYEFPGPHSVHQHYGVRTRRYKLMFFPVLNEWELFDLERDPREMRSVFADPAYAPVVQELQAELQRLRVQYQDVDAPEKK